MPRPDHFTRPVQSDRSSHEYGHTRLHSDEPTPGLFYAAALAAIIVIGLAVTVWS